MEFAVTKEPSITVAVQTRFLQPSVLVLTFVALLLCVLFPPRMWTDFQTSDYRPTRGRLWSNDTEARDPPYWHFYQVRTAARDYAQLAVECEVVLAIGGALWLIAGWIKRRTTTGRVLIPLGRVRVWLCISLAVGVALYEYWGGVFGDDILFFWSAVVFPAIILTCWPQSTLRRTLGFLWAMILLSQFCSAILRCYPPFTWIWQDVLRMRAFAFLTGWRIVPASVFLILFHILFRVLQKEKLKHAAKQMSET